MSCPACRGQISDDDVFCGRCGAALPRSPADAYSITTASVQLGVHEIPQGSPALRSPKLRFRSIAALCGLIAIGGLAFGFRYAAQVEQILTWTGILDGSRYTLVDGIRVYYRDYGGGSSAVVFIHGWSCDSTFWRLQTPARGDLRYILIDLPGHGRSEAPLVDYSGDLFARSVRAVIRNAGIESTILVGHSMGAAVALQFAHLYPSEVHGLVLVDGSLPAGSDPARNAAPYANNLSLLYGPDYRTRAGGFVDSMSTPQTPPALTAEIRDKMLRTPQHVMISAMSYLANPQTWNTDGIDIPVLVIDAGRTYRNQDVLRMMLHKLDIESLPGVGHFLMMENPTVFNAALSHFLQTQPPLTPR